MRRLIKQAAMLATASVLVAVGQVPAAQANIPAQRQAGTLVGVLASSRMEFSPNGDGHGERAVLRFRLAERSRVVVSVQTYDRTLLGPVLLGELAEYCVTRELFTNPRDKRTEDYITGRFG